MRRLRSQRDGILVSKETITDYSLAVGDLLRLRVLDRATGRFRVAPFHVAGIVQETRENYVQDMLRLLQDVTPPKILFWFSVRRPDYTADYQLPLGRLFGVTVRMHVLFPALAAALLLRPCVVEEGAVPGTWADVLVPLALSSLCGCAAFWDDVTSKDFKFKELYAKPDPMEVLRTS